MYEASKQNKVKAILPLVNKDQDIKYSRKTLIGGFKLYAKNTGKNIIDCRIYGNGSTAYCDLWVTLKDTKITDKMLAGYTHTFENGVSYKETTLRGSGQAGGYGYHKLSACIADAVDSLGIIFKGSFYMGKDADFKKTANFSGTGCHKIALLAICHSCGFNNVLFVPYGAVDY